MAGDKEPDTFDTGGVFTFGRSRFADNVASQFYIRNDPVVELACGDEHTVCICQKGRVFVFGSNDYGQLGLGHKNIATKPTCVKTLKPQKATHVACGRAHTIVTTDGNKLYTWGCNSDGQLGLSDTTDRYLPTLVETFTNENIIQLSAGSQFSAALTASGQVYVWGSNVDGQLGIPNTPDNILTPTLMPFSQRIKQISCGYYHTAFIAEDCSLYTCGEGESGKLGLPDCLTSVTSPRRVSLGGKVRQVSCGGSHTAAVTSDGRVATFGSNFSGQLGLGIEVTQSSLPTMIHSLDRAKIAFASCGECHTAFITRNGQLYTCGDGKHEKLCLDGANNVNMKQFTPIQITRFKEFNVETVTCGGCHTMVIANKREGEEEGDDVSQSNGSDSEESLVSIAQRSLPPLQRLPAIIPTTINNNIDMDNSNLTTALNDASELSNLEDEIVDTELRNDVLNELAQELEQEEVKEAAASEEISEIDNSESDEDIRLADEKTAEMKSDDEEEEEEEEPTLVEAEVEVEKESRVARFFNTFRRKKLSSTQSASEERITPRVDTTIIAKRAASEKVSRRREDVGMGPGTGPKVSVTTAVETVEDVITDAEAPHIESAHRKSKTCVII